MSRVVRGCVGGLLLALAVACVAGFRGVGLADRAYADQSAAWQRGTVPVAAATPGLDQRVWESLLGLGARAQAMRAYARYRVVLAERIPGTLYPQTQARFDLVERLGGLRSALSLRDRAAVDVVVGAVLTDGAKTAGEQRRAQLERAAAAFRRALAADPENDAAKLGLEVLLQRDARERRRASVRPLSTAGKTPRKEVDPKGPVAPTGAEGEGF
ncbi:MAG: hypothetical protein U0R50_10635 [Gaiellales bacterium]